MLSKLLVDNSQRRIHNVERSVGAVSSQPPGGDDGRPPCHAPPAHCHSVRRGGPCPCMAAASSLGACSHTVLGAVSWPQCVSGLLPDGRMLVNRAIDESAAYKQ